ncbi:hypothetical protein QBC41DRAFT_321887 [Cercophora samala]|uniref:Uncharacterized protein n=1 Tax=Cercophora samala TaxID=330535 RepID=A0AA39ZCK1_9PEZI|nr:hypothetical protein QBC41DRAFT_321887 [Cercophora samala]
MRLINSALGAFSIVYTYIYLFSVWFWETEREICGRLVGGHVGVHIVGGYMLYIHTHYAYTWFHGYLCFGFVKLRMLNMGDLSVKKAAVQ